jgi:hypothetical protein
MEETSRSVLVERVMAWKLWILESILAGAWECFSTEMSIGLFHLSATPSGTAKTNKQTNSVVFSPQANYSDCATYTFRRNLVPTFVDIGVSRGQRGGSPTTVNLIFLYLSRYFSFKESSCELGNEPSGSIKCWELPRGCTSCGLSNGTQLHRVS